MHLSLYMVYGTWYICSIWYVEYGTSIVYSTWYIVHSIWYLYMVYQERNPFDDVYKFPACLSLWITTNNEIKIWYHFLNEVAEHEMLKICTNQVLLPKKKSDLWYVHILMSEIVWWDCAWEEVVALWVTVCDEIVCENVWECNGIMCDEIVR